MKSPTAADASAQLAVFANPRLALAHQRFFKTDKGGYGEGDLFMGATVPQTRSLVRGLSTMSLTEVKKLLASPIHNERLLALLVMVHQYERGDDAVRQGLFDLYMKSTKRVNNWDLVDTSAAQIVGAHLHERDHSILTQLAKSKLLWDRRIAIVATHYFIKKKSFDTTLNIAAMLLDDREDLMHKAVGWMLREVGNRDRAVEEKFLRRHYKTMPRTMLRYAIEKFPEELRLGYLKGTV